MKLVVRPEAEQDIENAYIWYASVRYGLGEEFMSCIDEILDEIHRFPDAHSIDYLNTRRIGLHRFPYIAYYRVNSQIEVLAVLHASRDPKELRSRI